MAATPREAAVDDSKREPAHRAGLRPVSPLSACALVVALVGGLLLIAADLSTLIEVRSRGTVADRVTGGERHAYALALLGGVALVMAVGAVLGASRPAALALAGVGVIALLITLAVDLPDVTASGYLREFQAADASPARGYFLQLAGSVLLVLAGVVVLVRQSQRRW